LWSDVGRGAPARALLSLAAEATMDRTTRTWIAVVAAAVCATGAACAIDPAPIEAAGEALVGSERALVQTATTWTAPDAADGVPQRTYAWRYADGTLEPLDVDGAIDAEPWLGGAAIRLEGGALVWIAPSGEPVTLSTQAIGEIATSDDHTLLAWAEERDAGRGDVHVRDAFGDRVVAQGLASAGRMRFGAGGRLLVMVATEAGGVASVYAARTDGSGVQQLSNTGVWGAAPWAEAWSPPPVRTSDFAIDDDGTVRWTAGDGKAHAVRTGRTR
jgi:hypothetical protein